MPVSGKEKKDAPFLLGYYPRGYQHLICCVLSDAMLSFTHSLTPKLIYSFINSFINDITHSSIHSLIQLCWESVRCWVLFGAGISMCPGLIPTLNLSGLTLEGIAVYTYAQRPTGSVTDMPRECGHTEKTASSLYRLSSCIRAAFLEEMTLEIILEVLGLFLFESL